MALDPQRDFTDVADRLEPVTVIRPGSLTAGGATRALRRAVGTREAERSGGRYATGDVAWHLPTAEFPSPPRLGDVIVDAAGSRWTVLEVREATMQSRWRCVARNLALAHGLDQYVDVEEAEYEKGDSGAPRAVWRTSLAGVAARIQPVETQVGPRNDRQADVTRYTIFLAENLALAHNHRLRGPDGAVYTIAATRKADRIDALMEVEATRAQ